MEKLVSILKKDYPGLVFTAGTVAHWSPSLRQVTFMPDPTPAAIWALLHELGHALLDHTSYESDVSLLQKEAAAWEKAVELGQQYGYPIDDNHIQSCLNTYRDWLHKRSTCPACGRHGVQPSQGRYICLNCQNTWKVTSARFCRPYRLTEALRQR